MNSATTSFAPVAKSSKPKSNAIVRTVVAFVGIHPYRVVSGIKDARVGLQKPLFGGSYAWVLPNPSGLNAHYLPAALAKLFGELRLWAVAQHVRRRN